MHASTSTAPAGDNLQQTFELQRAAFRAAPYPAARERKAGLERLRRAILSRQDEIIASVNDDFGCRSPHETLMTEIYTTVTSIRYACRNLGAWMRPRRRPVPMILQPGQAWVYPQPLGVVGVISPWNVPVNLALIPVVAALAAGNRVMLKPSEFTPRTADLLGSLLGEVFPLEQVAVITGESEIGRAFADLPFNHLLFTGSTAVGREIMKAASANLTPVTLELGGKSPAVIAPDADLAEAAAAMVYGKLTNAGQVCIAPDYALVPRERLGSFCTAFEAAAKRAYPGGISDPEYTAIISERHVARLTGYIEEVRSRGGQIRPVFGDGEQIGRKLGPVVLPDPPEDCRVMQEEIFGPILPVKPYRQIEEAVSYINDRPRPLALYLFTKDQGVQRMFSQQTESGALCINDTLTHFAVEGLPFGGVGASGMGRYHGPEGFETFSLLKPVFRTRWWNPATLLRPPLSGKRREFAKWLTGK